MLDMKLWDKAVEFHGHECPGLAIGFKACEGAMAELGLNQENLPATDEELVCVVENDACGVDAVQSLLGCTYGKANLVPRLRGKMAFSFFVRDSKKNVRFMLVTERGDNESREDYKKRLLETPYEELFKVETPWYPCPEPARKFPSHACSVCGESTAEYALRVQNNEPVCIDCYDAYEREGFCH